MNILELRDVRKQYRDVVAVDDISLQIPKNTIYGLLGPNGAGKTSLIRMITQITGVDSGSIRFDGEPLQTKHTAQIGYLPEERGLYKKMKVGEQLVYLAQLKDLSAKEAKTRIHTWFERFQITDWWNKKVEDLSKGMQQKVQFISTVMHQPKLLILDEPFSGLDPINARLIRKEIFRLVKEEDMSVIFSTHRMEQVEEICEQIALINHGKKVLSGDVSLLKQQFKKNLFQLEYSGNLPQSVINHYTLHENSGGRYIFSLEEQQSSNALLQELIENDVSVNSFQEILPSMNEIFIEEVQSNRYE